MVNLTRVTKLLEKYDQMHLIKYYDKLNKSQKENLLCQIDNIDFSILEKVSNKENNVELDIEPIDVLSFKEIENKRTEYEKIGLDLISQTKLGVVILAGGDGTRLGINIPKGMLDIGLSKKLYLFEILIRNIAKTVTKINSWIPIFIMINSKRTQEIKYFFENNNYFDYNKDYIYYFEQDMLPSLDFNGKIILKNQWSISLSPDGSGNWFNVFKKCGYDRIMLKLGIEWINIVSVDNVLQKIADPCFLGATVSYNKKCSAKIVKKVSQFEKVGLLCLKNGKPSVVEYFEIDENILKLADKNGDYVYRHGLILNYLFNIHTIIEKGIYKMPLHLSKKKIEYCDDNGDEVTIDKINVENGYKIETLLTDMVELIGDCLPYEVNRENEFYPVKNKTGIDSLESARKRMIELGIKL